MSNYELWNVDVWRFQCSTSLEGLSRWMMGHGRFVVAEMGHVGGHGRFVTAEMGHILEKFGKH